MNLLDRISPYAERELRRALRSVQSGTIESERFLALLAQRLESQGKAMVLKRETATQDVS
jgi:hypothetical protein